MGGHATRRARRLHHHHRGGALRHRPRARRRPRPAEGRRRGPPPGAAGRRPVPHRGRARAACGGSTATDIGPVDLLCRDARGRAVAIEIKRRGEHRRRRAAGPLPGAHRARPRACDRCGACSSPRWSSPRPGCCAEARHRAGSRSTTTSCGASSARSSACSDQAGHEHAGITVARAVAVVDVGRSRRRAVAVRGAHRPGLEGDPRRWARRASGTSSRGDAAGDALLRRALAARTAAGPAASSPDPDGAPLLFEQLGSASPGRASSRA